MTSSAAPTPDGGYCAIEKPITWSAKDTPKTVKQIDEHNARWVCLCRNDCPRS
jgi:hypothetical protein